MRRFDAFHMDFPSAGNLMLRYPLAGEGIMAGLMHVPTLIEKIAIEMIQWRPS